jgi:hypothetical protein
LIAIAALVGWYHSRSNIDVVKIGTSALVAKDGLMAVQSPSLAFCGDGHLQWVSVPYDSKNDAMPIEFRGPTFGYNTMELKNGVQRTVVFPLWLAGIVFAILPALWVKRRVWRKSPESRNQLSAELAPAVK